MGKEQGEDQKTLRSKVCTILGQKFIKLPLLPIVSGQVVQIDIKLKGPPKITQKWRKIMASCCNAVGGTW